MKNKFSAIVLLFLVIGKLLSAQENKKVIPQLYKYLQNNTDSTIILTYEQVPNYPVTHFILSKKSDIITLYLYGSPYDRRGMNSIPREIRNFFQKRDLEINRLQIDTNAYFNVKYIGSDKAKQLWGRAIKFKPWQILDDSVDGEGCPLKTNEGDYGIYDGGSVRMFLITNDAIKQLQFYAPAFYNEKCPGRQGRITILKIEKLFKKYFDKE